MTYRFDPHPWTILRLRQVQAACGYSRSTLYLRMAQRLWPRPVGLGARAVGWPAGEVAEMNAARIASRTDAEIKALVLRLEAARAAAVESHRVSFGALAMGMA